MYCNNFPIHLFLLYVTFPQAQKKHQGDLYFEGMEVIRRLMTDWGGGFPEESFQKCIEAWQRKIGKSIKLEGDYFDREII